MPAIAADTEQLNGAGGTISLGEPTGLEPGELMLGFLMNIDVTGTPDSPPVPSGFISTLLSVIGIGAFRTVQRVADGSESGPYTSVIPGDGVYRSGKLLRISSSDPSTPVDGSNFGSGSGSTVTLASVTATVGPCLAVVWISSSGQAITSTPSGWTPEGLFDGNAQGIFSKTVNAGAASGAATCTLASPTDWYTVTVLVRPTKAPPLLRRRPALIFR